MQSLCDVGSPPNLKFRSGSVDIDEFCDGIAEFGKQVAANQGANGVDDLIDKLKRCTRPVGGFIKCLLSFLMLSGRDSHTKKLLKRFFTGTIATSLGFWAKRNFLQG